MADPTTAIILIHGIGDQTQRLTLRGFQQSLSRQHLAAASTQQTYREAGAGGEDFSYLTADSRIGDQPVSIAEYYWSDLSSVRTGLLSTLTNFFRLVVDAPDIVYSCLGPVMTIAEPRDYLILRCLRSVVAIAVWLIYFPIMAINAAYAAFVGGFAVHAVWDGQITPGAFASQTIIVTAIVASIAILVMLSMLRLTAYMRALAGMTLFVLAATFCFVVFEASSARSFTTYRSMAAVFNNGLNALWLVVSLCGLIYLLLIPVLLARFWERRHGILLGFVVTFLVIRFWLLFITTLWLIFLTVIFDQTTFQSLIDDIGGPIKFISLTWFEVTVIGAALVVALVRHGLHTRSVLRGAEERGAAYPRLIVPASVLVLALIMNVTGLAAVVWCNCAAFWATCAQPNCNFIYKPSEWIIANAAIFLLAGAICIQVVQSGFKMALDIVNYFRMDVGHRRTNPLEAIATAFAFRSQTSGDFRPRLQTRLDTMIEDYTQKLGPFDRIVVVAHSLGSMIAIDALKHWHRHGDSKGGVDLVTLGSPYTAIFSYYFPHMFQTADAALLPNAQSWTNIYRENDYVGTALTDGMAGVTEVRHPPLGHVDYMRHDAVVQEIVRRVFVR